MNVLRTPIACECGDHVFALATKGYVVLVSPEDAYLLENHRWKAVPYKRRVRITRTTRRRTVILAREIIQPRAGLVVDHINSDDTDNRRSNLREASYQQNAHNTRPHRDARLSSKGVTIRSSGLFQAQIMRAGERHFLGNFHTEAEAARAYRQAAELLHGEFARTAK